MQIGQFKQQGDVLIKRISKSDLKDMKKVSKGIRGFVLAEGEATGHAHVVKDGIELFEKEGTLFINSEDKFTITHEEHKPITVEKGAYEIGIVQEYNHFAEETKNVAD